MPQDHGLVSDLRTLSKHYVRTIIIIIIIIIIVIIIIIIIIIIITTIIIIIILRITLQYKVLLSTGAC